MYETNSSLCGRTSINIIRNHIVVVDAITGCKHDRFTQGDLDDVSLAGYQMLGNCRATHATRRIDVRWSRNGDRGVARERPGRMSVASSEADGGGQRDWLAILLAQIL